MSKIDEVMKVIENQISSGGPVAFKLDCIRARLAPLLAEAVAEKTPSGAITRIVQERERQIAKGFDSAHDDSHDLGEIIEAAESILRAVNCPGLPIRRTPDWVVHIIEKWRDDPARMLEIAAALVVAEMERRDRIGDKWPGSETIFCSLDAGHVGRHCLGETAWDVKTPTPETEKPSELAKRIEGLEKNTGIQLRRIEASVMAQASAIQELRAEVAAVEKRLESPFSPVEEAPKNDDLCVRCGHRFSVHAPNSRCVGCGCEHFMAKFPSIRELAKKHGIPAPSKAQQQFEVDRVTGVDFTPKPAPTVDEALATVEETWAVDDTAEVVVLAREVKRLRAMLKAIQEQKPANLSEQARQAELQIPDSDGVTQPKPDRYPGVRVFVSDEPYNDFVCVLGRTSRNDLVIESWSGDEFIGWIPQLGRSALKPLADPERTAWLDAHAPVEAKAVIPPPTP